jgi:glycosyltransferase involved in cell wall biosynthesis
VLEDGTNGLLVPPGDIDALARAVSELAADAPKRRQLGEAAARLAACWTWERVIDTVMREYHPRDARWTHEHSPNYCQS